MLAFGSVAFYYYFKYLLFNIYFYNSYLSILLCFLAEDDEGGASQRAEPERQSMHGHSRSHSLEDDSDEERESESSHQALG